MKLLPFAISYYSILRGVLSTESICKIARELGYDSVAIADRNNLYGLPSFLHWCNEYELTPLIAAQLCCNEGEAVLYAEGETGFSNLCRIISEFHCSSTFNLINSINSGSKGIHIVTDNISLLREFRNTGTIYYRMSRPRKPPAEVLSEGFPCLVVPPMAFTCSDEFETHKLLRAIACNTTLSRLEKRELLDSDSFFCTWEQILDRFEVFGKALETTEWFAKTVFSRTRFGTPIMPRFQCKGSSVELLRKKAITGAMKRYGSLSEQITKRINYELQLINNKRFTDYFLVVDDIVKQSPRTCGRGSGAASIIAYCLGITNVDPLRYNLMFERFLNPGRTDPPDIDVDFAWDERDSVLDYVFDHYGTEHTAMVATHQSCGARMAIREVARIYGLTEDEISRITKKIPWFIDLPEHAKNMEMVLKQWPTMRNIVFDSPWQQILQQAGKIIGMPRGIGTHCGGVVITPVPINTVGPIQYSAKGYPILQWEKEGVEEMGLVKIDLLGNRSLAVIRDGIKNIRREGIDFDEESWNPQSDIKTKDLFSNGKTIGVFYTESPAMRLLQRKTGVGDFEHLVIHSSIIRPAANRYIHEYIKRLKGETYKSLHPVLDDVLGETYGIMVYQEDVSKVAMAMAGFCAEDADMLRKIMSKKSRGRRFEDFRVMFFKGALKNGVKEEVVQAVWEMMLSFSGYSFCKPHSASYVQVSFQAAYLKAHHPAAFMAAVLSNYGGYYATQAYISEAQRLGIKIVPPDVNRSECRYFSYDNTIVTGFCQIKGLCLKAQQRIVQSRKEKGYYKSLKDFIVRTEIDESDMEKLLLAGACDNLCRKLNRSQQFWQMRKTFRSYRNENAEIPRLKALSLNQFLLYQYQTLGFLTSCHPVTLVRCAKKGRIKAKEIRHCAGKNVTILGWCITAKTVSTKMGDNMEFVTFEDETDIFETVFFPQIYNRYASILRVQSAFLVSGKISAEFGAVVLEVNKLEKP